MSESTPNTEPDAKHPITILVDGRPATLPTSRADGREIKAAAGLAEDLQLHGPNGEPIANNEHIELHEDEQFTTTQKPVRVVVNNRTVEVPGHEVTGAQIKQAAGVPADFKLYGPNGDEITDDQIVRVKHDERFTAISGQDVS